MFSNAGKNTPNPGVATFDPSPMPQTMNSGTSAISGTGSSADTTAIPGDRSTVESPIATPHTVSSAHPIASPCGKAPRRRHSQAPSQQRPAKPPRLAQPRLA